MNTNQTITVRNIAVKVVRKKIKNLHLAVYPPDGRVKISVPESVDDETVRMAIVSKLHWIKRRQKPFVEQARQSAREYVSRESHYYLGRRYLLEVRHDAHQPPVYLHGKQTIRLCIDKRATQQQREKLMMNWYRAQMRALLPGIIHKWQDKTGLCIAQCGIKRMKTKWGSCNPAHRRIWLNLELMKKPVHCIEYVVVHEMVHFVERLHNDNFIAQMDRHMPQWRRCRDDLNRAPLAAEAWTY